MKVLFLIFFEKIHGWISPISISTEKLSKKVLQKNAAGAINFTKSTSVLISGWNFFDPKRRVISKVHDVGLCHVSLSKKGLRSLFETSSKFRMGHSKFHSKFEINKTMYFAMFCKK